MDYDIIDMIWTMMTSNLCYHSSYHTYDFIYDIDNDIIGQTYAIKVHELLMISQI
jgi:hypothetical protein